MLCPVPYRSVNLTSTVIDMVDPVKPSGGVYPVKTGQQAKFSSSGRAEKRQKTGESDDVKISKEAFSLAQAQESAKKAGMALKERSSLTLSTDPKRLNALV